MQFPYDTWRLSKGYSCMIFLRKLFSRSSIFICTLSEKAPGAEALSWLFLHNQSSASLHKKGISLSHLGSYYGALPGATINSEVTKRQLNIVVSGKYPLIMRDVIYQDYFRWYVIKRVRRPLVQDHTLWQLLEGFLGGLGLVLSTSRPLKLLGLSFTRLAR